LFYLAIYYYYYYNNKLAWALLYIVVKNEEDIMRKLYFYHAGRRVAYATKARTFFGLLKARRLALRRAEAELAEYCEFLEREA
jgi:hypothetical protein